MTAGGDLFVQRWRGMREATLAFIAALPEEILSFVPSLEYRSIEEMARHLIAAQSAVILGIAAGDFPWRRSEEEIALVPWRHLLIAAADLDARLLSIVTSATADWLAAPPPGSSLTRSDWLWRLLEHEIHHRGQLSLMVRLAGMPPPKLYE